MNKFIPKVLLIGDENEIPKDVPEFEIVGKLEVEQLEHGAFNLILDGKSLSKTDFESIDFDYVVCTDNKLYWKIKPHCFEFFSSGIFAPIVFFQHFISNIGFTAVSNIRDLYTLISKYKSSSPRHVLDLDAYLYRSDAFDFHDAYQIAPPPQKLLQIETVMENFLKIEPIWWNVYDSIFTSFDDVKLRNYDVIFMTAERSFEELLTLIDWAEKSSKIVLIFIHCDSPAMKSMKQISNGRSNYSWTPAVRGEWLKIDFQHVETCRAYVVTHKKYFLPKLPEGYEMIHGGKKNSTIDLGFQGDDTGDNISDLNLYLNELTVTYWAWKNAPRTDYIGFSHYSRYFILPDTGTTNKSKNYAPIKGGNFHIITMDEVMDLLKDCDILAVKANPASTSYAWRDESAIGWQISKKYIEKVSLESWRLLEKQHYGQRLIAKSMFFTRWKVFDEYCKWMFAWAIPSAQEYMPTKNSTDRYISSVCESMSHVFCVQNNLRIKLLNIVQASKESTPENPAF